MNNTIPLVFEGDELVFSGWTPPDSDDVAELNVCCGSSGIDLDEIVALPERDTFLWRPLFRALKEYHNDPNYEWFNQYQGFGTCVGQAEKVNNDDQLGINAIFYMDEFPGRSSVAGAYTFSRVEVGKQPGRWEGSNCVRASTASMKYGVLLLKDLGLDDNDQKNDEALAMKWTASKQGVPTIYEEKAGRILVQDVIEPKSIMMAAKLVQCGAGGRVGTTYIPTGVCNSEGISPCKHNRGGHAMCIRGVRYRNGKPYAFLQQQSWYPGWKRGPNAPGISDQPRESVWISAEDYWIQIQDGDCRHSIGINGLSTQLA